MSRWSGTTPRPQVSLCPDGQAQCPDDRSAYVQMVSHNAQTTGQSMSRWSVTMPRPQFSLCPDGQVQCPDHRSVYVQSQSQHPDHRSVYVQSQSQHPDHRSVYVQMISHNAQTTGQSMSRRSVTMPRPQVNLCPDGQS